MRKDSVDKLRTTKCCLKKGGKQHEPGDCRTPLCSCGKAPLHHQLICPAERIQMMNIQPTYQMVQCDQDTANQHLAMAEMMSEDNVEQESDGTPAEQDHLMQFSMVSGDTYGNRDQMFAY